MKPIMIIKPNDIVDDLIIALKTDDCPLLNERLDDLQELLVSKIMAGDLASQGRAHERLIQEISENRNLGDNALRALLKRISVDPSTALHLISQHEDRLVNDAIADNLMRYNPEQRPGSNTTKFYLAKYWLFSEDYEIFDRYLRFLMDNHDDSAALQYDIINTLFEPLRDHKEIYYNWVAKHQDRIIALTDGAVFNFAAQGMHRGIEASREHLAKIGKLITANSRQSPNWGELYEARALLGVTFTNDRLQREWSGHHDCNGWGGISTLASLMSYHLSFEDSKQPEAIGGQPLDMPHAMVHAMKFVDEKGIEVSSKRIGDLVDKILTYFDDPYDKREAIEVLQESGFHNKLLSSSRYRDSAISVDLGL